MKKQIIGSIIIFTSVFSLQAQEAEKKDRRERMEQLKEEYILERLELNEDQKDEFIRLNREFREAKNELRNDHWESGPHPMLMSEEKFAELNEEEALDLLKKRIDHKEQMLSLEKEYNMSLMESISAKKVLEYKQLETEFRRELMKMVKDDKERHHLRKELMHEQQHRERMKPRKAE